MFSRGKLYFGSVAFPAILIIVWSCFSLFSAEALLATGFGIVMLIKAFLLYFYIVNNVTSRKQLLLVANMLVLSMFFQGFIGVAQKVMGHSLGLEFLGERRMRWLGSAHSRVSGTMGFPNPYGAYFALILPLAISLAVFARRSLYKLSLMAACFFGALALFLCFSRSAWAGFALGMVVMILLMFRNGLLKPKYLVGLFVAGLVLVAIAYANKEGIERRMETGAAGEWRMLMIEIAIPIIKSHPVFGVGLNNYQWHSYDKFAFWKPVHNDFLRYAAEIGIPGAIFFILVFVLLLKEAYKINLLKDAMLSMMARSFISAYLAFIVVINIGPQYQNYHLKLTFWTLAGLTFALRRIKLSEIREKKQKRLKAEIQEQKAGIVTNTNGSGNSFRTFPQ
jgi:O-antigen ligase